MRLSSNFSFIRVFYSVFPIKVQAWKWAFIGLQAKTVNLFTEYELLRLAYTPHPLQKINSIFIERNFFIITD